MEQTSVLYTGCQSDFEAPPTDPDVEWPRAIEILPLAIAVTSQGLDSQVIVLHTARPCDIARAPERSVAVRAIHHALNLPTRAKIADADARSVDRLGLHNDAPLVVIPIRLDAIRYAEEAKIATPFEAVIGCVRPVQRTSSREDAAVIGKTVREGRCQGWNWGFACWDLGQS